MSLLLQVVGSGKAKGEQGNGTTSTTTTTTTTTATATQPIATTASPAQSPATKKCCQSKLLSWGTSLHLAQMFLCVLSRSSYNKNTSYHTIFRLLLLYLVSP